MTFKISSHFLGKLRILSFRGISSILQLLQHSIRNCEKLLFAYHTSIYNTECEVKCVYLISFLHSLDMFSRFYTFFHLEVFFIAYLI